MDRTRKLGGFAMVLLLALLASCASVSNYSAYRTNLSDGYTSLLNGQYQAAIQQLVAAGQTDTTKAIPLALAGQAAYQMGNYTQARQYLSQAESRINGPDPAYVIIKGYEALIAFRENKREEGMEALHEYVRVSRFSYPDKSYYPVERMYRSGDIVLPTLERHINDGLSRYEMYLQQWGWNMTSG
jgi:tetratricopeptide (TPR) repeat protein